MGYMYFLSREKVPISAHIKISLAVGFAPSTQALTALVAQGATL